MELEPQLPAVSANSFQATPGDVEKTNGEAVAKPDDVLNSSAENSSVEQQAKPPLASFFNSTEPRWEVEKEQPWHRAAAFAFALGATAKDVAKQLGRAELTVQNLLRQTWFQANVTALMAEYGGRDIMELLRAEQINSLCTLIEIRDNPKAASAARVVCARDILDRTLGKPMQRVEMVADTASENPVEEVERLEAEVNRLKTETT